jgi:fatty-acyl-CoA synthase
MLIRGGENIFPKEIEDYLMTHSNIQNVQVIGVNDIYMGEEICAWIQLRDPDNTTP